MTKASFDSIEFDGPTLVSEAEREQLVSSLGAQPRGVDSYLKQSLQDQVRAFWRVRGYVNVAVKTQLQPLGGDESEQHFRLIHSCG